jgi:hypothetical protein
MEDHMSNLSTGNSSKTALSIRKESLSSGCGYEARPEFISAVASILREIINESEKQELLSCKDYDIFSSKKVPSMSIEEYLQRIVKYTKIEESMLISVVVLIDRACEKRNFVLKYSNIHKILMSSVLINIKFLDDDCFENSFYAKVGGMSLQELNLLEYHFYVLLNFNAHINKTLYRKYRDYFQEFLRLRRKQEVC